MHHDSISAYLLCCACCACQGGWSWAKWTPRWSPVRALLRVSEVHYSFSFSIRHENGGVKFWDVTTGAMRLIYALKTANLFVGQESHSEVIEDFSDFKWPPYHKVSSYDPFEDDPRLAIKCIEFCPLSKTLCIGGNGGQVISFSLNPMPGETSLEVGHSLYVDPHSQISTGGLLASHWTCTLH